MTICKATGMPACKGDIDSQAAAWLIELEDEPFGPELLEHGRQGLLVDPDDPAQIAEAIVRVQTDPSLARQLGEAGRARVRGGRDGARSA